MQNANVIIFCLTLAVLIGSSASDGNFTRWQVIRHKLSEDKTSADNGTMVNFAAIGENGLSQSSKNSRAATKICSEIFKEDGTCDSFESCCDEACKFFGQNPQAQCADDGTKPICQCTGGKGGRPGGLGGSGRTKPLPVTEDPEGGPDGQGPSDGGGGDDGDGDGPRPRPGPRRTTRRPQSRPRCGIPMVPPSSNRIVGGEEAVPHSWPWQASLHYAEHGHICGGSVIDNTRILTAAHCVEHDPEENNYQVILGLHDRDENGQSIDVQKISIHPRRNRAAFTYDAAILHLAEPIRFSDTVMPVCLPKNDADANTECTTTGWGKTNARLQDLPQKLMQLQIPLLDKPTCQKTYGPQFDDTMICAGDFNKGSCQGDSGGPFVCQNSDNAWELNGIVSFGIKGCNMNDDKPSVYSRVMSMLDWIKQTK